MRKTKLSKWVRRARAAAEFAKVTSRTQAGQVQTVIVPGHSGKQYQVIIRRNGNLSAECRLDTTGGYMPCPGNSNNGKICYHSISAVEIAAKEQKLSLSWCQDEHQVIQLSNLGGKPYTVTSHQGSGQLWVIAR